MTNTRRMAAIAVAAAVLVVAVALFNLLFLGNQIATPFPPVPNHP